MGEPELDCFPEGFALSRFHGVSLALLNAQAEALRNGNPGFIIEKERIAKDQAPNLVILVRCRQCSAILLDPDPHLLETGNPVLFAKDLPRQAAGQAGRRFEKATTNDEVLWAVQLEEQRFSGQQRSKRLPSTGLPEVDFIKLRPIAKEPKPLVIGNRNVELHVPRVSLVRSQSRNPWTGSSPIDATLQFLLILTPRPPLVPRSRVVCRPHLGPRGPARMQVKWSQVAERSPNGATAHPVSSAFRSHKA